MDIRDYAYPYLQTRLEADASLRERLGFGPQDISSKEVKSRLSASKVYESGKSATRQRAWWHTITLRKLEANERLVLLCEAEDDRFHILDVPCSWLRDNRDDLSYSNASGGAYLLHLSAEPGDRFLDRRGGILKFNEWVVE